MASGSCPPGSRPGRGWKLAYDKDAEGPIVASGTDERLEAVPVEQRQAGELIRIAEVNGEAIETYSDYLAAFAASGGRVM